MQQTLNKAFGDSIAAAVATACSVAAYVAQQRTNSAAGDEEVILRTTESGPCYGMQHDVALTALPTRYYRSCLLV